MTRLYLVAFRSHHEEPFDALFVDVHAESPLKAIKAAVKKADPLAMIGQWVIARVWPWPEDCETLDEATHKLTGTSL